MQKRNVPSRRNLMSSRQFGLSDHGFVCELIWSQPQNLDSVAQHQLFHSTNLLLLAETTCKYCQGAVRDSCGMRLGWEAMGDLPLQPHPSVPRGSQQSRAGDSDWAHQTNTRWQVRSRISLGSPVSMSGQQGEGWGCAHLHCRSGQPWQAWAELNWCPRPVGRGGGRPQGRLGRDSQAPIDASRAWQIQVYP